MFEAYTDRAARGFTVAMREAHAAGAREVRAVDAVLAILREIPAEPPDGDGRRVHEPEALAGILLGEAGVDVNVLKRALRAGEPRPDFAAVSPQGAPTQLSGALRRALDAQARARRGGGCLALDTAAQLTSMVPTCRRIATALGEAGLRNRRTLWKARTAIRPERADLDAQARAIFTPAQLRAWG